MSYRKLWWIPVSMSFGCFKAQNKQAKSNFESSPIVTALVTIGLDLFWRKMSKEIIVRSRGHAAMFKSDVPFAAISVSTKPFDWPVITEKNRVGLLQLSFTDRDMPQHLVTEKSIKEYDLFRPDHAKQILDFVSENWEKVDAFLIHCEAGLSRSPAIAAAITKISCGEDDYYFRHYSPNRYIYRTILEAYFGPMIQ